MEELLNYVVRDGMEFGPLGVHKAGTVVQLTAQAASAFPDKLKLVAEVAEPVLVVDPPATTPFPYLSSKINTALIAGGFSTQVDADNASNESLLAVDGVGAGTLASIRENGNKGK